MSLSSLPLLRPTLSLLLAGSVALVGACSSSSTTNETPVTPDPNAADGGGAADTGSTPATGTGAFTSPAGEWTWNAVEGMECGNGAPTGVGVNVGTSDRVVVFFEGGGACWNGLTCFSAKTAAFIDTGFGETEFQARIDNTSGSLFDRSSSANVFKDDSWVYIPYCTGDVHAGSKVTTYDDGTAVHHVGLKNAEAALKRIAATWKGKASRVVVSGSSAGGFGAAINYERFAQAFAPTRVDLVDDSGPPIPASKSVYLPQWNEAWDLFKAFPADCSGCASDPAAIVPYYSAKYPSSRFALLSYDHDNVISKFYGMNQDEFKTAIEAVATTQFAPLANGRTFYVSGTSHTMLGKLSTASGGTTLAAWLRTMITDGADWKSVAVSN